MCRRNLNRTRALAALLLVASAVTARATPGNGIRLGGSDGRLHPFFDLETRYDSNVSYTSDNSAVGDLILHVRPGAELKVPGDVTAVEFVGAVDWAQYLGIEADTRGLSKLYGDAALAALFNKRGAMSLRIDNEFRRQISTTSLAAATTAVVSNANVFSLSVPWRPGGGALVVEANGQWLMETFQKYKDEPSVPFDQLGYSQFRGGGDVQWHFLPRTSAVLEAGYFSRVPNVSARPDEATGFDALTGLTGLLTPHIAATAKVGFGSTYAPTKDVSSFLADVALEWLPLQSISFRTGYLRSFGLDPTASVYVADTVNGTVRVRIAERFALQSGVRYDRLDFQAIPVGDTFVRGNMTFLRVDPTLEGSVGKWLTVGIGYVFSSRASSSQTINLPDYSKNEGFLRLGFTY